MSWSLFTNFGNSALLLPLAILAFLLVFQQDGIQTGFTWLFAFGLGCAVVAISKILFYGWGFGLPSLNMAGFSGHAFLALTVWPLLSWKALRKLPEPLAWIPGLTLGALVAISRVKTGAHSVSEIVAGSLLALAVLALTRLAWRPTERRSTGLRMTLALALLPVAGLVLASTVEQKLPTEHYFRQIGIALSGAEKPMSRARWLKEWTEQRN